MSGLPLVRRSARRYGSPHGSPLKLANNRKRSVSGSRGAPMTNTLRLELFGGFRIAEGTTPLSGFTYSKGKALLAFLAVTGQPCPRETLAALLWSKLPDSEAR